jgi:hypothetical protein
MKRFTKFVAFPMLVLGLAIVLAPTAAQAKGNGGSKSGGSKGYSHESTSYCHDSKSYCHDSCHNYCHDYCRDYCFDHCYPSFCQPYSCCEQPCFEPDYCCTSSYCPSYCGDYCTANYCGQPYCNFSKGNYKTGGMYKSLKK